nr:hypothetical protein [Allomuricauda sp.]
MGSLKSSDLQLDSDKMFDQSEYGKPISKELSTILRRNLDKNNMADIASSTNMSYSTVRDVVYRTNSLTPANAEALCLLVHAAYQNSIGYKLRSEGDMMFLDSLLNL